VSSQPVAALQHTAAASDEFKGRDINIAGLIKLNKSLLKN
jgi:hypothetical protein